MGIFDPFVFNFVVVFGGIAGFLAILEGFDYLIEQLANWVHKDSINP